MSDFYGVEDDGEAVNDGDAVADGEELADGELLADGVGLADDGEGVGDGVGVGLVVLVGCGLAVVGGDVVGCCTTVLGEADGVLALVVTCEGVGVGAPSRTTEWSASLLA